MTEPVVPMALSKQDAKAAFAKRLYTLMTARGWRQSDLARHSGLPRDAISSYVRAKVFPTPQSIEGLCRAFGMTRSELVPFEIDPLLVGQADTTPSFEAKFLPANDGSPAFHLKVNQRVTLAQLQAIADALGVRIDGDAAADGK